MHRASMWREVTHMVTPIRGTERDESVSVMRCAAERGGGKGVAQEHTFGVDGSQVGVLEQRDEVRLGSFLKGHHSGRLEPQVGL